MARRGSRIVTIRRAALMASTSLVLTLGAGALLPELAHADCLPFGGPVVTCDGPSGAGYIELNPGGGDRNLTVNPGAILGNSIAIGFLATPAGVVNVLVHEGGTIAPGAAIGVQTFTNGDNTIENFGTVTSAGTGLFAIVVGTGDASITNSGRVTSTANQALFAQIFLGGNGTASAVNAGTAEGAGAFIIGAENQGTGAANATNNGTANALGNTIAVTASASNGSATVTNTRTASSVTSFTLQATATNGDAIANNSGTVTSGSGGLFANISGTGNASVTNSGHVTSSFAQALFANIALGGSGTASATNTGTAEASVSAVLAQNLGTGAAKATNSGTANAQANGFAVAAESVDGSATATNTGIATSVNVPTLQAVSQLGAAIVNNGGTATSANASAIEARSGISVVVNNSGLAQTSTPFSGFATVFVQTGGTASVHNQSGGTIRHSSLDTSHQAIAAQGSISVKVVNDGTIVGNMNLVSAGDITIDNNSANTWSWSGTNSFTSVAGNIVFNNNANGRAIAGPSSFTTFQTAGNAIINNAGTFDIFGPFDPGAGFGNGFEFNQVGGRSLFNNTGTLNLSGLALFGGLDGFNNKGGTINTGSAGVMVFGGGSVFNNAGVINVNPSGTPNGIGAIDVGIPLAIPASFAAFQGADQNGNPNSSLEFHNAGGTLNMINQVSRYAGQGTLASFLPGNPALEGFFVNHDHSVYRNSMGDVLFLSGNFHGGKGSTLALDAFLSSPTGSSSDLMLISGNTTGNTRVVVNNTNFGGGAYNPSGILLVTAAGDSTPAGSFTLANGPIDTGFFDYDLFHIPRGSADWVLKSYLGAGAFVLPQLTTAAQDLWHAGASTWFDRTADLRVLLAGGAGPSAYAPTGSKLDDGVQAPGAVPAVWMRGSGSWLDRDDSETVRAHGRTYQYNLDRELETFDFQVGLDLGTRDVLGAGDILVFGALGGFVHANLDYEQIARGFDLSGGQVGGYATYLNGGLFVDTLLNVHFLEVDTPVLGFPKSLDATTIGLRTDAGYRFGSFTGGAFIEPLATIAVTWADLDGFSVGGNSVSFDDDANVRGRLGLRVGTSYDVTTEVKMEPFVIGSVWGNLSGDTNTATLTSSGTAFVLKDQLDDVWGEVSAGVNFFNFGTGTTVFAKVDVTFGDDVSGVGGKAGMRVAW